MKHAAPAIAEGNRKVEENKQAASGGLMISSSGMINLSGDIFYSTGFGNNIVLGMGSVSSNISGGGSCLIICAVSSLFHDYNWGIAIPSIPVTVVSNFVFDVKITYQGGTSYANGSSNTIVLFPPNFSHSTLLPQSDSFFRFNMDPAIGYTSAFGRDQLTAVTGINFNPITGKVEFSSSYGGGPWRVNNILGVQVIVRPPEALTVVAVLVVTGVVLGGPAVWTWLTAGGTAGCKLVNAC